MGGLKEPHLHPSRHLSHTHLNFSSYDNHAQRCPPGVGGSGEACGLLHRRAAGGTSPCHRLWINPRTMLATREPGQSPPRTSLAPCWPRRACPGRAAGKSGLCRSQLSSNTVWSRPKSGHWALLPCLALGRRSPHALSPQVLDTAGGQQVA